MKKHLLLLAAIAVLPMLGKAQGWPDNYGGVMLQGFSWNSFGDTRWVNLTKQAEELSQYFNLVWVPQSGWTGNSGSMGYDVKYYFNQRSAFGTETELREMISTFKGYGTGMIADVVVNHRGNASNWVDFPVETYNGVTYQMTAADITKNDDGGATATWLAQQKALGNIPQDVTLSNNNDEGEDWGGMRDLDHKSENVRNIIKAYVKFLVNDLGYTGFRYDMTRGFWANRVAEYNDAAGVQFSVGENWSSQTEIQTWIDNCKWNGKNMSASFDFPFRYTVRDVIRGKRDDGTTVTWKDLNVGGVMANSYFKRYAVTFVENHDTQYRDANNQNDPLRKDTLAANAYLLTMPGTPCVFLPHWKAYKQEIKNMIDIRKAVGVTNVSMGQKFTNNSNYAVAGFRSTGANGKYMYCVVGEAKRVNNDNLINQLYGSSLADAVQVSKGYGYRLYMSKNSEMPWVDKANGKYDAPFTATLTAVSATSSAQLVYTLDGSTPTASSTKVASGTTVSITEPCTLKVGLLKGNSVSNVITRKYDFSGLGDPHTINVYVNADDAGWNLVRYYTWDQSDVQHNGNWPGEQITQKVSVGGKTWYVRQYLLANDDCYMNFVFNTGATGAPQTIDVRYATTDKFYMVKADLDPDEGKNMVTDVTEDYAGLPVLPAAIPGDVDGDGHVSSVDVTALYNYLLNEDASDIVNGDQDGDGHISSVDITVVYNIMLGN